MLKPEVRKVADEFYKRYEDKMKRPPAGHASPASRRSGRCSPRCCPKAKTFEPAELREIALKLDLPEGSLVNGSGIKFTNNDWPADPKDAGQNLRASIGVWQWQKGGNNQVFPQTLATHERGHGAAAGRGASADRIGGVAGRALPIALLHAMTTSDSSSFPAF